jgi:hypothetical protein
VICLRDLPWAPLDPGPLILRNCASAFALSLCLLFNKSLASCAFPDRWKLSFVTPVFKSGKRNDVSNYRVNVLKKNYVKKYSKSHEENKSLIIFLIVFV